MATRTRRVAGKGRPRQKAQAAGGFGILAVIGSGAWMIGYGITALIVAVICGLIAGTMAALHLQEGGASLWRPRVEATTVRERVAPVLPKDYVYKTRKQRALQRRRNIERGHIHTGTTKMSGPDCSIRCRESKMPSWFCKCRGCGGASHGSERGILPIRWAPVAPPASPKPAAVRRPAGTGAKKNPVRRKTASIRPQKSRPTIPAGGYETPLILTWRDGEGSLHRVQSTKGTAVILESRGQLVKAEPFKLD